MQATGVSLRAIVPAAADSVSEEPRLQSRLMGDGLNGLVSVYLLSYCTYILIFIYRQNLWLDGDFS